MNRQARPAKGISRRFLVPVIIGGVILAMFIVLGAIFRSFALVGGAALVLLGLAILWLVLNRPLSGAVLLGLILVLMGVVAMHAPMRDIGYTCRNRHYLRSLHVSLDELASVTGKHGDRYVVYDQEKGELLSACLPAEYRAHSLEDLAGVFTVETNAVRTGYYSGKDDAYTIMQTITLHSAADGAELGQERISGGKPPEVIVVDALWDFLRFWNRDHYGTRPTEAQIREACMAILKMDGAQGNL